MNKTSTMNKIILFSAYAVFLFFLFEIASRIVLNYISSTNKPKIDYSYGWRKSWIQRHKHAASVDGKLHDISGIFQCGIYDKTKGWNLKPNVKDFKGGGIGIININSRGIRSLKEYNYQKPKGRKRIVMLGDSFTFGLDNDDENIFPSLLEKKLPNTDVINLGVPGYAHDQILLKLEEEGVKYNPDLVVLFFDYDDAHRNTLTFRDYAKPKYVLNDGKLLLTNVPVPLPEVIMKVDFFSLRTIELIKLLNIIIHHNKMIEERDKLTTSIIKKMSNVSKKCGARFAVFAWDNDREYLKSILDGGIECYYVVPNAKHKIISQGAFLRHWTPEGHRIVAECMSELIENNNLLNN